MDNKSNVKTDDATISCYEYDYDEIAVHIEKEGKEITLSNDEVIELLKVINAPDYLENSDRKKLIILMDDMINMLGIRKHSLEYYKL